MTTCTQWDVVAVYWKCLCQVIAATVKSDPVTYNEAFLGKLNEEYVQWILNPEKWGGG